MEIHDQEYNKVFAKENPLVSVVITTYNAGEMLCNYSLPSVLNQTHKNLEIIIINDGSIDDTEERLSKITDSRIIYKKIEHIEPMNWYATGVNAINHGLELCTGNYISHLDDDDWFLPEKIEKLVNFNRNVHADIVHHKFYIHYPHYETYKRVLMESLTCSGGNVTTSSLFYHGWFSRISFGDSSLQLPGDWNKAKQILDMGGIPARCPEMLLLKNGYRECTPLRNRLYRPQLEPGIPRNIKNGEE